MAFLRIDELKLENIRCFDDQTFSFTEGVNVITGPNGSGKSTIITAIGFGLYGADYLKESGLSKSDLVKRDQSEGTIKLTFTTHEGTFISDYKLRTAGSDYWRLFHGSENNPVIAETITETREVIQSQIGENIDHQTFKTALCSRQGEITKLLDTNPAKRNDLIKKILGLENFDRTNRVVSKFMSNLENQTKVKESELTGLNANMPDIKSIEKDLRQAKKKMEKANNNYQDTQKKQIKITEAVELERQKKSKIDILNEKKTKLKEDIKQLDQSITAVKKQKEMIEEKLDRKEISVENIQELVQKQNTTLNEVNLHHQQQKITHEHYLTDKKELNEVLTSQKDLKTKILEISKEYEKFVQSDTLEGRKGKLSEYNATIKSYDEKKNASEREILQLKTTKTTELTRKEALMKTNTEILTAFQTEFQVDFTQLDKLLNDTTKSISESEKIIPKIQEKKSICQQEMGSVKSIIASIEQTIQVLNNTAIDSSCPVCKQSLQNVNKSDLIGIQTKLREESSANLQDLHAQFKEITEDLSQKERDLEIEKKRRGLLERYLDKKQLIEQNKVEVSDIASRVTKVDQLLKPLEKQLEDLKATNPDKLRSESETLRIEIEHLEKLTKNTQNYENKLSLISEKSTELHEKLQKIDEQKLLQSIKNLENKKAELIDSIAYLQNDVLPLLNKFNNEQVEFKLKISEYKQGDQELKQLVNEFNNEVLKQMEIELTTINEQIGRMKETIENGNLETERLQKELDHAMLLVQKQTELNRELDELASLMPLTSKIQRVLSEAPEYLIGKTSSKISNHLTNMLKQLLPNQGFDKAKFQNDGDVVVFTSNQPVDKNTLSGGEKTVLALALRMALADYVAPLQYLTLDEPTNHLDAQRVEEFIEIIDTEKLFAQSRGQLLLVTHKPEFNRNAQNSIELEIANGIRQKITAEQPEIQD